MNILSKLNGQDKTTENDQELLNAICVVCKSFQTSWKLSFDPERNFCSFFHFLALLTHLGLEHVHSTQTTNFHTLRRTNWLELSKILHWFDLLFDLIYFFSFQIGKTIHLNSTINWNNVRISFLGFFVQKKQQTGKYYCSPCASLLKNVKLFFFSLNWRIDILYYFLVSGTTTTVAGVSVLVLSAVKWYVTKRLPCIPCAVKLVIWHANNSKFCGLTFHANRMKTAEYRQRAVTKEKLFLNFILSLFQLTTNLMSFCRW